MFNPGNPSEYKIDNPLVRKLASNFFKLRLYSLPLALILLIDTGAAAQGEVVPDNTLPQNSIVEPNGNIVEITGGTSVGNNLFHSFEQFSIVNGETAFFDNAIDIENIINRVIGSSISEIDGLIQANGTANLFLINPNGIVFGENAALNIGGSFIGTSANSLIFDGDGEFSAVNPESSLLTVNIPVGLQFGNDNGELKVEGQGHNAFFDFDTFTINRFQRNLGLEVAARNTFALVGNNITLAGGNITAEAGNIELGSIAEGGVVELTETELGFTFDYGNLDRGDINLTDQASIDVSGDGSGNIQLQGDTINLIDGSAIFAETEGDATGNLTRINANQLNILGTDPEEIIPSSIWSDVYLDATGDGGSVEINTASLLLEDGAQVNVNTFSLGNAGNLTVNATDIEVVGESPIFGDFVSGLFAQADIFLTGRGGNITLDTDNLLVTGGGQINASTFGDGDAGNLSIQARDVELTGGSEFGASGLFISADGGSTGNGGNLDLETTNLLINNGAQIVANTFGEGDAGSLTIDADNIELASAGGIFNQVETAAIGDGGDIVLTAEKLAVNDSALITAITRGEGNGGNIALNTDSLQLNSGGQIAVTTFDLGDGGTLDITADSVELNGASELGASGIFSSALVSSGNGGNINLNSDRLSITNGATISVGNFPSRNSELPPGTGETGTIVIDVNTLDLDSSVAEELSNITASANSQAGGDIVLNISADASISNGSQITAETQGEGEGGNINFTADQLSLRSLGQISVNSSGVGNAGDMSIAARSLNLNQGQITATATDAGGGEIDLTTDSLLLENNSLISTSVLESDGDGGNITINNRDFVIGRNHSSIRANAVFGDGGNIQIYTTALFFDSSSEITASSQLGVDGIVEVNDIESARKLSALQLVNKIKSSQSIATSNCPVSKDNTFALSGKGGIPNSPGEYLRGEVVWQDLRIPQVPDKIAAVTENFDSTPVTIVEAQSWQINQWGNVELTAKTPLTNRLGHEFQCASASN